MHVHSLPLQYGTLSIMSHFQMDQSEIKPANAAQIKHSASSQNVYIKVDLLTIVHDKNSQLLERSTKLFWPSNY